MPRISPHRQQFVLSEGLWRCARCLAPLASSAIEHLPGCEAVCRGHQAGVQDEAAGWDLDVYLDLAELGLQHRRGAGCTCKGRAHRVSLGIDPARHGLVPEDEVPALAGWTEELLQLLHEQAHPDGTLFAANCREPGCAEAW